MERKNWTREETLLAFNLYCKTPFGKIHKSHPDIIALAHLIGRTPDAVGMKMCNLASHDPSQVERGISGLKNGSKIEKTIWKEFEEKGSELIVEAEEYLFKLKKQSQSKNQYDYQVQATISFEEQVIFEEHNVGTDRKAIVKQRVGQDFFRKAVLSSYDNKCCITGINLAPFLIASHIKPWIVSDDKTEKINPSNGLCLNALHDKAFDKGFITIDNNYRIIVSSKLKGKNIDEKTKLWITSTEGKKINLPTKFLPNKKFIEYHNDIVFKI